MKKIPDISAKEIPEIYHQGKPTRSENKITLPVSPILSIDLALGLHLSYGVLESERWTNHLNSKIFIFLED